MHNWDQTHSSCVISGATALSLQLLPKKFARCLSLHLQNGKECSLNDWVIFKSTGNTLYLAKVIKILQVPGSDSELLQRPNYVLLLLHSTAPETKVFYQMPKIVNSGIFELADFNVSAYFNTSINY